MIFVSNTTDTLLECFTKKPGTTNLNIPVGGLCFCLVETDNVAMMLFVRATLQQINNRERFNPIIIISQT